MKQIDVSTPKYPNTFAMVDDEDFEWLNKSHWHAVKFRKNLYVIREELVKPGPVGNRKVKKLLMHREIMKTPLGMVTDHIDGNGLNNQKANLRIVTNQQNHFNRGKQSNNTSGYKGVSWNKTDKTWCARMMIGDVYKSLGQYKNIEDAASAYIDASKRIHGEYSVFNRPNP